MAGIYFHIPFCKQACYYCDFHFSTSLKYKQELLDCLQHELHERKDYLSSSKVDSIYFGGGSPSILEIHEIQSLIDAVADNFEIDPNAEISLEANPDDLNKQKVKGLKSTDINRFSIGIQSFYEEDLKWMNRAHTSSEAEASIKRVQDAGFENITCDLIYGYPLLNDEKWKSNINYLIKEQVPHISCYSMTVEPRTALAKFISVGKTPPMNEGQSAKQFELLTSTLQDHSYEHYEISNFAKKSMYAKHNTNYWRGIPYLGIGPSAHSFDGISRSWNISNNALYIKAILNNTQYSEKETLSPNDRLNEYIMTSLRTMWGIDIEYLEKSYGSECTSILLESGEKFIRSGELISHDNQLILSFKGKLVADYIASELFFVD